MAKIKRVKSNTKHDRTRFYKDSRGNLYSITKYVNGNVIIHYPGHARLVVDNPKTFTEAEKRLKRTRSGITRVKSK